MVVPAYNVEAYISDCLESLLAQTYADIEVLVVDDGSIDETASRAEALAAKDSRIRVFRNENRGVSCSRNYAIDRGAGEYLLFVDADDVVAPDYVEALVGPLSQRRCELSCVNIARFAGESPQFSTGKICMYKNKEIYKACLDNCKGFLWKSDSQPV